MTIKRIFDVVVAAVLIVVLTPMLVTLGIAIRITMGAPVLFRQIRPGHQRQPFTIFKFRTMNDGRDAEGRLLPDHDRVTRLGMWLRRTSLDEIPELVNVLRGEMSLVGPRPLIVEYLDHYTPEQDRRHEVKPGITGLAQTEGRNAVPWEQRFALDLEYVENQSFLLDLRILATTARKLFARNDATADGLLSCSTFGVDTSFTTVSLSRTPTRPVVESRSTDGVTLERTPTDADRAK